MKTSDFEYHLPPELIAQQAAPERTNARMMVVRRATGSMEHRHVSDLPEFLQSGDLLVVNDTRVFPARVFGHKEKTGGQVEILLIEELTDDLIPRERPPQCWKNSSMGIGCRGRSKERHTVLRTVTTPSPFIQSRTPDYHDTATIPQTGSHIPPNILATYSSTWEALMKSSRPSEVGSYLLLASGQIRAEVLARLENGRVRLRLTHERPLMEILEEKGVPPLPPYIKRSSPNASYADSRQTVLDRERYQTVYARVPGAIAAPTAGLHFTLELLNRLKRQGVECAFVTLHVGPGTFQPVTTETVEAHRMESERYFISAEAARTIASTHKRKGRIIAVGSTVVRTLETVAAEHGTIVPAQGRSGLFIFPPYSFRIVQALLTNFHLPRSTLLMMVSAFAGPDLVRRVYETAIRERYRFYSYGDCMLIL